MGYSCTAAAGGASASTRASRSICSCPAETFLGEPLSGSKVIVKISTKVLLPQKVIVGILCVWRM
jgi:hypothetical protein